MSHHDYVRSIGPVARSALLGVAFLSCGRARVSQISMPDGSQGLELRCPRGEDSCDRRARKECDGDYQVVSRAALSDSKEGTIWRVVCGTAPRPTAQAAPPTSPSGAPPVATMVPAPVARPAPERPRLSAQMSLEFVCPRGTLEVYERGRATESESDETWKDGGLRFVRVSPGHWLMIGNLGSNEIEVHETAASLVFVERSPIDAFLHVMTIEDVWLERQHGFRTSYVRTMNAFLGAPRMISTCQGWVRIP